MEKKLQKLIKNKPKLKVMNKKLLMLLTLMISVSMFAQKKELKAAEKSYKKKDYENTLLLLKSVEPLLEKADDDEKVKYLYVKTRSYYGDGTSDVNDTETVATANELIAFEEKIGKRKYSREATIILNKIITRTVNSAVELYGETKYKEASNKFLMAYAINEKDTINLDNAATSSYSAKDYDKAIELYEKLLALGYTGIQEQFKAVSIETGEVQYFRSKADMNKQVKLKLVKDPEESLTESKVGAIAKNIAGIYIAKGDQEKALKAIDDAQKIYPNDYTLLISEANIYFQLGDNEKFLSGLKKAIEVKPGDPILHYNVGVLTMDQGFFEEAIVHFKEAIRLKPDYADAYTNIGVAVLEKTKPIVEEMNKNLSNFDKYDALQVKQKAVYKEALPYYEKAHELVPTSMDTMKTLASLYEVLGMYAEQKAIRAKM